jgi:hypothetical protein
MRNQKLVSCQGLTGRNRLQCNVSIHENHEQKKRTKKIVKTMIPGWTNKTRRATCRAFLTFQCIPVDWRLVGPCRNIFPVCTHTHIRQEIGQTVGFFFILQIFLSSLSALFLWHPCSSDPRRNRTFPNGTFVIFHVSAQVHARLANSATFPGNVARTSAVHRK